MSTARTHPQVERYIKKLRSHLKHLSEADRTVGGVAGDIAVDAKTGPVALSLAPDYDFTLRGEASIGRISCNFPVRQEGDGVTATVGKGTHSVNVSSKIGQVTITRSPSFSLP